MRAVAGVLLVPWASLVLAQSSPPPAAAPFYAASSVVNAADYRVDGLAPNTIATIYGKNLACDKRELTADDIRSGSIPYALPGTGVKVIIAGVTSPLLYVSPEQINFIVPPELGAGTVELRVGLDSLFGPAVKLKLFDAAPGLFPARGDPEFVAAAHNSDGAIVSRESPARGGEVVLLFATGLGSTYPPVAMGQLATSAAQIDRIRDFRVLLGTAELPKEAVLYAGLAPGFAGLYQINLRLPRVLDSNPEVRIGFGSTLSPAGLRLRTE